MIEPTPDYMLSYVFPKLISMKTVVSFMVFPIPSMQYKKEQKEVEERERGQKTCTKLLSAT